MQASIRGHLSRKKLREGSYTMTDGPGAVLGGLSLGAAGGMGAPIVHATPIARARPHGKIDLLAPAWCASTGGENLIAIVSDAQPLASVSPFTAAAPPAALHISFGETSIACAEVRPGVYSCVIPPVSAADERRRAADGVLVAVCVHRDRQTTTAARFTYRYA